MSVPHDLPPSHTHRVDHRRSMRARSAAAAMVVALGAMAHSSVTPAGAQTTPLQVSVSHAIPGGATISALPVGQQTSVIVINNPTASAITNVQMVARVAVAPAAITVGRDPNSPVGVVDPATGFWYHTIAQIPPNTLVTYTITWLQPCSGKWPVAVRVGDRVEKLFLQFAGTPNPSCPPDEVLSNQPPAYYALAWPPSLNPAVSTSTLAPTTVAGATTTVSGATTVASTLPGAGQPSTTLATAPTTSAPAATSTTLVGAPTSTGVTPTSSPLPTTTAPLPTTTRPAPVASSQPAVTAQPGATTTTLLQVNPQATQPTTTIVPTTTVRRSGPTTTVVILCKTIGGKRYCAPQSSVYKPGQKKAVEVKPKATKKKTKKK